MTRDIERAYSGRASEYIAALGTVERMDPFDVMHITRWGSAIDGPILDAGSGPGHWTGLLRERGCDIRGVDVVPEFVDSARARFPSVEFKVGDLQRLPFKDGEFSGVLAWYSIIHTPPDSSQAMFQEFNRVLRPDGSLLVGVFMGRQGERFEHAITEAFYWSEHGLSDALVSAGFEVVESHPRVITEGRSHLAVVARRA